MNDTVYISNHKEWSMKKIKMILPVIFAGAFLVIAGCSDHVAEGEEHKGSAGRAGESGRGRVATDLGRDESPIENKRVEDQRMVSEIPVSLTRFEGTLAFDDPEWYLDTGDAIVLLHLGNRSYLDAQPFELSEGAMVETFGIMEDDGLMVVRITTDEGELALRSDTGVPLWAGNGNRPSERPERAAGSAESPRDGGRYADEQLAETGNGVPGGGFGTGRGSGQGGGQDGRQGPGQGPAGSSADGTGGRGDSANITGGRGARNYKGNSIAL